MRNLKKFQISKNKQKNVKGGNTEDNMGVCIIDGVQYPTPCNERCPNGTRPFCFA
ncbi:hypothetical protein [Empedobacter falsenii]|uniref:Bacteriocin n=1 Tax=Empedobacter falsenii TaxID=343874 RepID=A0AAW7DL76_9FLAO|nr:hypothetical protein [Empedobacter falsenii]MDM1551672.1 hypothetical protein [Empedobacter falsenii]